MVDFSLYWGVRKSRLVSGRVWYGLSGFLLFGCLGFVCFIMDEGGEGIEKGIGFGG